MSPNCLARLQVTTSIEFTFIVETPIRVDPVTLICHAYYESNDWRNKRCILVPRILRHHTLPNEWHPVAIYNAERYATSRLLAFSALYFCVRDQSAYIAHAQKVGKSTLTRLRRTVNRTPDINDLQVNNISPCTLR